MIKRFIKYLKKAFTAFDGRRKAMKKIIVFGSLNMDLSIQTNRIPKNGETIDGSSFFSTPGGKGANQAVAATKSGANTFMIGNVGNDFFGKQLISTLEDYSVNCTYVAETDKNSGIAMIIRSEGDNRIILDPGANHTLNKNDVSEVLSNISEAGDIFLTQFENDHMTVLDSIIDAKARKLFTVLNPAPAKEIPNHIYQSIDLLIVNQSECEFLTGIYPETEEACREAIVAFREKGASSIIITLGAFGSVYGNSNEFITVPSYKVKSVDTTAAGDAYIGALLYSISTEKSFKESMVYATKAAALTISKQGAQQSIPYKHEIDNFKEEK